MKNSKGGKTVQDDIASQLQAECTGGSKPLTRNKQGEIIGGSGYAAGTNAFRNDVPQLMFRLIFGGFLAKPNASELFVGGFISTYKVICLDCCVRTADVEVTGTNIAGMDSFTRPPSWSSGLIPDNPLGRKAIFGNTGQILSNKNQAWRYTATINF